MAFSALVIDDEEDNREVISNLLELYDVRVLATGNNGKQAVELFQKHKPDVVFSDILMPEYDGIYGLKHIRELDQHANFVVISASIDSVTEKKLEREQPTLVFDKPYDLKEIVTTINEILKQNKRIRTSQEI